MRTLNHQFLNELKAANQALIELACSRINREALSNLQTANKKIPHMTKTSVNTLQNLKAFGIILSLGAFALGGGLVGCAGTRSTQSTGQRIDDHGASSRVKTALSADTQYKYDMVTVETFKGTVQLSGFVNSRDQKNRAADLAKKVEGVKEVVNNIIVKESTN
jgi:hyperosmotically inducible protein